MRILIMCLTLFASFNAYGQQTHFLVSDPIDPRSALRRRAILRPCPRRRQCAGHFAHIAAGSGFRVAMEASIR